MKSLKPIAISNNEKVDLDSIHNHFDNIITYIERDMKKKPNQTEFIFQIRVSKN